MNDASAPYGASQAAPSPYVPVSGGAVTALVLSVVLFFVALFGPWWCEIIPVILVLFCWGAISQGRRRGKPVAIIALVLALLGGGIAYWTQKTISTVFGEHLAPVVVALEKGNAAEVSTWLADDAPDRDATVLRWIARSKAAHAAEGAFSGDLEIPFSLWGFMGGLIAKPDVREEFEPRGTEPVRTGSTFWFKARCARGAVYVAFDCGSPERFRKATEEMKGAGGTADSGEKTKSLKDAFRSAVAEVRYFR